MIKKYSYCSYIFVFLNINKKNLPDPHDLKSEMHRYKLPQVRVITSARRLLTLLYSIKVKIIIQDFFKNEA